jgi:hypothetical protein
VRRLERIYVVSRKDVSYVQELGATKAGGTIGSCILITSMPLRVRFPGDTDDAAKDADVGKLGEGWEGSDGCWTCVGHEFAII